MSISDLATKVRERINTPRWQDKLLGCKALNIVCSALDIVEDAEVAFNAFLNQSEVENIGLCYLLIAGVLQYLQSQQDAVAHICVALDVKNKTLPKIPHICEIRSSTVAHPVKRKKDKTTISCFIERATLNQNIYNLIRVHSDETPVTVSEISIREDLIAKQWETLHRVFEEVIAKMDEAE